MADVLVVEDHPVTRDLAVALLTYGGHRARAAGNGAEALVLARASVPDLIITDIVMPGMDGYELLREIRADPRLRHTAVVLHTANYLVEEVRPVADGCGVRHILAKPAEPEAFLAAVDDALAAGPWEPSASVAADVPREHLRVVSAKLADKLRELEATQSALVDSEARFRVLAESSPVGIFALDGDGRPSYANPRLRQIAGIDDEPTLLAGWADLFEPDERDRVVRLIATAAEQRQPCRGREQLIRPSGERRWVDFQFAPVLHAGGPSFVGTVEDVTDNVESQRRREELEARLRASERLESLGQLAGGIAHDFNNLLGALLNYAHLVEAGIDELARDGETQQLKQMREDMAAIRNAADRGADLARQLLVVGRAGPVRSEVCDLNTLVREAEVLFGRTIGEGVRLELDLAADLWPIQGDPGGLTQVIVNLVVNARDAMFASGTVRITTENLDIGEGQMSDHGVLRAGRYVRMEVIDEGEGMAPETAARAFEPFFTTKPKDKGTGLGLATAYGIVDRLGGHIGIRSELGRGTTVTVYVPAADDLVTAAIAAAERPHDGHEEVVLVADDDAGIRATTERILSGHGYRVVAVADGRAAMAIIDDREVDIDLLLTDVVMPEATGWDVARQAAVARPGLAVMFMSGFADGLSASPTGTIPGGSLLEKPFTPDALLRAVREVLDSGVPATDRDGRS